MFVDCFDEFIKDNLISQRQLLRYRDSVIPLINLRRYFEMPGEEPKFQQLVIVQSNGVKLAMIVDRVIGPYQTVVKNLGVFFKGIVGLGGATILGDGTVALVIDVSKIIERTEVAFV